MKLLCRGLSQRLLILLALGAAVVFVSASLEAAVPTKHLQPSFSLRNVNRYFSTIQQDPNALYAFFLRMPKGGELHYHLAGGAYAETMLKLVGSDPDYCINLETNTVYKGPEGRCRTNNTQRLEKKPTLYNSLLNAWSMRAFVPRDGWTGHDQFFSTFDKFIVIIGGFRSQLIAAVLERAARQNEHYMEIMDMPDDGHSMQFAPKNFSLATMKQSRAILLRNPAFQKNILATVENTDKALAQTRHWLNCAAKPQPPACNITVKIQAYVLREQPINVVFVQALNAFEAANRSSAIVAVNLVQSEGGVLSTRDYSKQMRVFQFLHHRYPKVHISLHAGELTNDLVTPQALRFHIREAIAIGQAERIGHGVDIASEQDASAIMSTMKKRNIAVEINLVSNHKILGVWGARHPLKYYLNHGVAVTLSSDDEGVLRTDLTAQYVEAAYNHHLDYTTLRQINHHALTYSFLQGKSLWLNPASFTAVKACADLESPSCLNFIKHSEKAKHQRVLELALRQFEQSF